LSDLDDFLEQFGVRNGPAGQAYKAATSIDELYEIAAERLLEHARAIAQVVLPPKKSGLLASLSRVFASTESTPSARTQAAVVMMGALSDLAEVREFFRGPFARERAAGLSLKRIYDDACDLHLDLLFGVPEDEKGTIRQMFEEFGSEFIKNPRRQTADYAKLFWRVDDLPPEKWTPS